MSSSMTQLQRRHLAMLRIRRKMPEDFAQLGLTFNIHRVIAGTHDQHDIDVRNTLSLFRGWNQRSSERQLDLLLRLIKDHPTHYEVRDRKRCRLAREILRRRGYRHE